MDTMRGGFGSLAESEGYDQDDDATTRQAPPPAIGQDERRMQVRAYNHWASLLNDRNFPGIEDLEPENLPDFGPYSVLLDFSSGVEDPGIAYLGDKLAEECDIGDGDLNTLADVPSRSLLSRITDHYLQIIANQAPIGFEAEFVNQRGATIAYRGILLPYSSDDDTIDFIYGVINWKELADAHASDELLLEIDQALEPKPLRAPLQDADAPLTDWADGPGAVPANDMADETGGLEPQVLPSEDSFSASETDSILPVPSFGLDEDELEDEAPFEDNSDEDGSDEDEPFEAVDDADAESPYGSLLKTPIHLSQASGKTPIELPEFVPDAEDEAELGIEIALPELDPSEMELGDWLAAAREMAAAARSSEDRTRNALYEAIGRAYDFSLAAAEAPGEFDELLTDSGLTMQDRAPMTPVVKLVFGADYDKTRLTEFAAALAWADRTGVPAGALAELIEGHAGGLKGIVAEERGFRRRPSKPDRWTEIRAELHARPPLAKVDIAVAGEDDFVLLVARREGDGLAIVAPVADARLVEQAIRKSAA